MSEDTKTKARQAMSDLLSRVMADGKVDWNEAEQIRAAVNTGVLGKPEVHEIFRGYLKALSAEVLADGVVTGEERERCRAAVGALHLPMEYLPHEMLTILDESK